MSDKYEFIDSEKANYPLVRMFGWMGVSGSGFYEWRERPASVTATRRAWLAAQVKIEFEESDGTYGYRRIHVALARRGIHTGPELVRSLMRELDLVSCQPRPWRVTTDPDAVPAAIPDLVAPGLHRSRARGQTRRRHHLHPHLGRLVVPGDRHRLPHQGVVGWAIADHLRTDLVCDALSMAARNYPLAEDCIFHSDRGTQYMSDQFAKHTDTLNIRRSVGRTGNCYDNALAESFNGVLKVERVNRTRYATIEEANRDIVRYIEFRYNRRRLHSALGYRTPQETYEDYINKHGMPSAA